MIELERKQDEKTLILYYSFDVSNYIIEEQDYLRMYPTSYNPYGGNTYNTIGYSYMNKEKTHYMSQAINHDISEAIQMVLPLIPVRGAMYFGDKDDCDKLVIDINSDDTSYPSLVAHSWFVIGMMNAIYGGYTDKKSHFYKDYTSNLTVGYKSDNDEMDKAIKNAVDRYSNKTVGDTMSISQNPMNSDSIAHTEYFNSYNRANLNPSSFRSANQDPPKKRGRKKVTMTKDGPDSLPEGKTVDMFGDLFVDTKEENKDV